MSQRSLVLLKPDAVRRGLIGEIVGRIERKAGWQIAALELRNLDRSILEQHYGEHVGKPFYEPLVEFMASGPVVALVVEGERVIEGLRALAGPTDPIAATAIGSRLGVPHRLLDIIEGESLVNDGTALVLLRSAPPLVADLRAWTARKEANQLRSERAVVEAALRRR